MVKGFINRIPLFWLLQIAGWGGYAAALLLTSLPYLRLHDYLVYRSVGTAACFASSFLLLPLCRNLWRTQRSLTLAAAVILGSCWVLGFLSSALGLIAENHLKTPPPPFSWSSALSASLGAGFVLLVWATLYFGIKYYQALDAERRRAMAAESLARDAELRALRYQIQPHFLFNTLNAISTLVVEGDSASATRMISRLADFFRSTLDATGENEVLLENEMFLAEQYLEIEKIRLGARLEVDFRIAPAVRSALVPNLLLQPLIENAIRHGIAPRREGGRLSVSVEERGNRIRIVVADNGAGNGRNGSGDSAYQGGVGVGNVERRLRQLYGSDYEFDLIYPLTGGCKVAVELPLRVGRPQGSALLGAAG